MTALAHARGRLVTSPILAESIRTSPIVVRRLVAKLAERGLVRAHRGKAGGLELARAPQDITLREIYEAFMDKRLLGIAEKPAQKQCVVSCSMKKILCDVVSGVEQASLSYLEGVRLSDLVERVDSTPKN